MKRYPWRVVALCGGAVALAMPAKAPSVTFQGPGGGIRTIKVLHPEKL